MSTTSQRGGKSVLREIASYVNKVTFGLSGNAGDPYILVGGIHFGVDRKVELWVDHTYVGSSRLTSLGLYPGDSHLRAYIRVLGVDVREQRLRRALVNADTLQFRQDAVPILTIRKQHCTCTFTYAGDYFDMEGPWLEFNDPELKSLCKKYSAT